MLRNTAVESFSVCLFWMLVMFAAAAAGTDAAVEVEVKAAEEGGRAPSSEGEGSRG